MNYFSFDPYPQQSLLLPLIEELSAVEGSLNTEKYARIVKKYPQKDGTLFSKDQIIHAYRTFVKDGIIREKKDNFSEKIRMKPIRTLSGVTPVTVLTKPFPCPGKCIFCPNDVRMPKSYLHDEPGAQRAERNQFDPYLQTYNRLLAFQQTGHITDKVEIIVLGGTWSFYPENYQIWFIKRCFEALNDFGVGKDQRKAVEDEYKKALEQLKVESRTQNTAVKQSEIHGEKLKKSYNQVISELYTAPDKLLGLDRHHTATWDELYEQHLRNENAKSRCVGLVIETRPDNISEAEVIRIRKLGCTKTQIGFQSLQDDVLEKNKRGHDVDATRRAVGLLRQAGFKIHAHWMPNLYGSTPELDKKDFHTLFHDPDFKPDELKIYPCSLIQSAELMQYYKKGLWKPYTEEELADVLVHCFKETPEYCRLTRVIRDIPSTDIVVGNKKTNFREIVEKKLVKQGISSRDIRSREIKSQQIDESAVSLVETWYETTVSTEVFLQWVTPEHKIIAFLRLSLPKQDAFISELKDSAMIREVHVYGKTTAIINVQETVMDRAQHLGYGKRLIERAKQIAVEHAYQKLQVISAIGTREYYRKQGFMDGELYQYVTLT